MPTYLVSGSAFPSDYAGDVAPLEEAAAGEDAVSVDAAAREADGDVQFTLRVVADDAAEALAVARRVADRLTPDGNVTVVGTVD